MYSQGDAQRVRVLGPATEPSRDALALYRHRRRRSQRMTVP
jgi:hypothetical protein